MIISSGPHRHIKLFLTKDVTKSINDGKFMEMAKIEVKKFQIDIVLKLVFNQS